MYVAGTNERMNRKLLSLNQAKSLARIGSQEGSAREVVRGFDGMIIREYEQGVRVFPLSDEDLDGFRSSEVPKDLRG